MRALKMLCGTGDLICKFKELVPRPISRGAGIAFDYGVFRGCGERRGNRRLGSGDKPGETRTRPGSKLELGGVLTAKFLTQLTGLLVIQPRLAEITVLAILESETTISGRIVRVHL